MVKKPQWDLTLDAYHRFVVERLVEVFETSRSDVIQYMIRSWVSGHLDQVEQAGASIGDWEEERKARG